MNLVHCGALEAELRRLVAGGRLNADLRSFPSGLCTDHRSLSRALRTGLARCPAPAILCVGECVPNVDRLAARFGATRVSSINCISMLLGDEEYRRGLSSGTFYLLPEWAERWPQVFERTLGLAAEIAGEAFGGLREAVYLDTGIKPIPASALAGFSSYCGLPVRCQPVKLDRLSTLLAETIFVAANAPVRPPRGNHLCRGGRSCPPSSRNHLCRGGRPCPPSSPPRRYPQATCDRPLPLWPCQPSSRPDATPAARPWGQGT